MDTVKSLDKDIWVIDHPFRMPGGIELGARSTIVRLSDGGLWLHSPGPLTPAIENWLKKNGPLRAIVAPNLLHHLFLKETMAAFPDASVYGPEGLQAKLAGELETSAQIETLKPQQLPWPEELRCLMVEGFPDMNELVFLHPSSGTLILTDLVFNIVQSSSLVTRIFLRINGALGKFGPSRLARLFFMKDRAKARESINEILGWDFDRVVMSHGDVLPKGGHDALREGYRQLLEH